MNNYQTAPGKSSLPQPLPEPLRGADPDSFAYDLVAVRLQRIGKQTINENPFSPSQRLAFENLLEEIPDGKIRPIRDQGAPDLKDWQAYTAPYLEMNWFEVPWFFVENYFYRRVLEATGYFQEGNGKGVDPYRFQKETGFSASISQIRMLCAQLNRLLDNTDQGWHSVGFMTMLYACLWGNQSDLSMWPVGEKNKPDHNDLSQAKAYLLADGSQALIDYLSTRGIAARIDFLIDNAGFELVSDLCLADYILTTGLAQKVRFHLKTHPTFVSDALVSDVKKTIESISALDDRHSQIVGERLAEHLRGNCLELVHNLYWNSPLPSWEMHPSIKEELGEADLVISKGDANYRRAVGDLHWSFTFSFQEVLSYFPAPFLGLRVLKSELALGLKEEQVQELFEKDPKWLVNGRWGILQFAR
jgi:uncharacterized protein with ATP-grasp and redox domains